MDQSIGKAYKPWLIASVLVLVGSLGVLGVAATAAFVHPSDQATPLWVIALGVVGALGVGFGFAGFFLMMLAAGWQAFRETRRVQVIPPEHMKSEG